MSMLETMLIISGSLNIATGIALVLMTVMYLKAKEKIEELAQKVDFLHNELDLCYEERNELCEELESYKYKLEDCETTLRETDYEKYDLYVDRHYVI